MTTLDNPFDYITKDLDDMSIAINYNRWIISLMKPYIGNHVLEVGAGSGTFTQSLRKFSNLDHITALEPSQSQYEKLVRTFPSTQNVMTFKGFLADFTSVKKFDTIIYNNVLEHIEDDIQELQQAKEKLNPGGYILVYSPALPCLMSNFDKKIGHFHRYTKNSIQKKLEKARLKTVHFQYVDFIGTFLWYIKFKLLKSEEIGSTNVAIFDKIFVPLQAKIEKKINIPIGKNILTVCSNY